MKHFLLAFLICTSLAIQAQDCPPPTAVIEFNPNNIKGHLTSTELIFNDNGNSAPGFEAPVGEGVHSIYAANFWIGGLTQNDDLKLAAGTYNQNGTDFYNGPLSNGSADVSPEECSEYDRFFSICEYESLRHLEYFDCISDPNCDPSINFPSGYSIPESILQYPAHGDINLQQDFFLAPFYDYDSDGNYSPEEGDYPLFSSMTDDLECSSCQALSGHKATFWITNDKGNLHFESNGDALGIEMHNVVYGFSSSGSLNDIIFHQKKLINKGSNDLIDTYMGYWVDFDLGNSNDDLIGCDISRNLAFVHNADQIDEASNSTAGYGENPPAAGLLLLEGINTQTPGSEELKLTNFTSFSSGINDNPQTPIHYYNYLKSTNQSGVPHVFPGTEETTNWMFGGDTYPNSNSTWDDDFSSDKRALGSSGPFDLNIGDVQCITNAYLHSYSDSEETSALENLFEMSDETQQSFDNCFDCVPPLADIQAVQVNDFAYNFHNIASGDEYLWDFDDGTISTSVAPGNIFQAGDQYTVTLTVSNECGTDTDSFNLNLETFSQPEINFGLELLLYPNPARGVITYQSSDDSGIDLQIIESTGKIVFDKVAHTNETIDISNLAKGHYIIRGLSLKSNELFVDQLILLE